MRFYATSEVATLREKRLIAISHIGQLGKDINDRHLRTDGIPETVGALPMAGAVAVTKIGNAIAGDVSNALGAEIEPVPLPKGNLPFIRRDVVSLADNLLGFAGNVIKFRPVPAAGNLVKGAFDAVDLTFIDPALDGGIALFGHSQPKAGSRIFQQTRQQVSDLKLAA